MQCQWNGWLLERDGSPAVSPSISLSGCGTGAQRTGLTSREGVSRWWWNLNSGLLAPSFFLLQHVASLSFVRNVPHIFDSISMSETCCFINSFLLNLHFPPISPERIQPISDEDLYLKDCTWLPSKEPFQHPAFGALSLASIVRW